MPGLARSIRPFPFTSFAVLLALASPAAAEDLLQVFREAQRYDAVYAAARHSLDAGRERGPQGLALLLPTLNLSGSATRSQTLRIVSASARKGTKSPSAPAPA